MNPAFATAPAAAAPARARAAFTLIEVILAVGVLSLAILTLAGLIGGVFQQVESVVRTNKALAVVASVNAALETPELIAGTKIPKVTDAKTPKFDVIYDYLKGTVGNDRVNFFYLTRRVKDANGSYVLVATVYNAGSGGNLTKSRYDELGGHGPVFRVEISIGRAIEKQRIQLDQTTARPKAAIYEGNGAPLPSTAAEYALAFLPLYLEVFPYTLGATVGGSEKYVRPILAQNIVINR